MLSSFANKHVEASVVSIYTTVQPIATGICAALALAFVPPASDPASVGYKIHDALVDPGVALVGVIPTAVGVAIVARSRGRPQAEEQGAAPQTEGEVMKRGLLSGDSVELLGTGGSAAPTHI